MEYEGVSMTEYAAWYSSMNDIRIRLIGFHTAVISHSSARFHQFNENIQPDWSNDVDTIAEAQD